MQHISQQIRSAVKRPEEVAMHCQTFASATLAASYSTCKEIVDEIKKVIKDRRETPATKVNALKVRHIQIFHACMMAGNQLFLAYAVKKIIKRLAIMAKHNYASSIDFRGSDLFEARDAAGQIASADFLKCLLSYIQIWSENYGKGPRGVTEYYSVYSSLIKLGVTFPMVNCPQSSSVDSKASAASSQDIAIGFSESLPHKSALDTEKIGVNQEEIWHTISLLRDLLRSADHDEDLINELVNKLQSLLSKLETEIEIKATSCVESHDIEKLFGLNDQVHKVLREYFTTKREGVKKDCIQLEHRNEPHPLLGFKRLGAQDSSLNTQQNWQALDESKLLDPQIKGRQDIPPMQTGMPQVPLDRQTQFNSIQALMMQQQLMHAGHIPSTFQTVQPQSFLYPQPRDIPSILIRSPGVQSNFIPDTLNSQPCGRLPIQPSYNVAKLKECLEALSKKEIELVQEQETILKDIEALEQPENQPDDPFTEQLTTQLAEADAQLIELTHELEQEKQRNLDALRTTQIAQEKAFKQTAEAITTQASLTSANYELCLLETSLNRLKAEAEDKQAQLQSALTTTQLLEDENCKVSRQLQQLLHAIEDTTQKPKQILDRQVVECLEIDTTHAIQAKPVLKESQSLKIKADNSADPSASASSCSDPFYISSSDDSVEGSVSPKLRHRKSIQKDPFDIDS